MQLIFAALGIVGSSIWAIISRFLMPAVLGVLAFAFLPFVVMIGFVAALAPRATTMVATQLNNV